MGPLNHPYPDFCPPSSSKYFLFSSIFLIFFILLFDLCSLVLVLFFLYFLQEWIFVVPREQIFLPPFPILLQYSLSYFLFPHPYNTLAVYLPSNSLLNILSSSSFSCCLTSSSSSLQYSLSNSLTNSIAFFKFSLFFHISSSAVHLFHHTKYLSFSLTFLLFMIFSTSHSL